MAANELRFSGLVLAAALAALMLSACAPRASVAIRLPSTTSPQCAVGYVKDAQGNCVDLCTVRNCGTNARCLKSQAGWADCVCDRGFKLLPDASCAHLCTVEVCGENGYCEEDLGSSSCHCNTGFEKTADGCVDTCVLQECGENGQCVQDENGAASCVCDPGFTLRDDGKSCHDNSPNGPPDFVDLPPSAINRPCPAGEERDADGNCVDSCVVRNCGPNANCLKFEAGWANCVCERGLRLMPNASCSHSCSIMDCGENAYCEKEESLAVCHCNWGYAMTENGCVGPATCGNCPNLATCALVSLTRKAPYCVCPTGYGMTSYGCIRGATPTVSSASFTLYDKTNYTLSPYTYTTRLNYTACTNVPKPIAFTHQSYWRVDHAPGGAGDCMKIILYHYPNCVGPFATLTYLSLTSITAVGVTPTSSDIFSFMCMR
ncbi:unnamed protein product [Closterium sp. NIES-64]|nr:unnamed protein product [Closterium sp. NIES-64]